MFYKDRLERRAAKEAASSVHWEGLEPAGLQKLVRMFAR